MADHRCPSSGSRPFSMSLKKTGVTLAASRRRPPSPTLLVGTAGFEPATP